MDEVKKIVSEKTGFVKTMWCGDLACEEAMKTEAGLSSCCMPFEQEHLSDVCPVCGKPMTMNLRCDNTFVQDEGWYAAYSRYEDFLRRHEGAKVVYMELGVGGNTPVIIKYPFWKMTKGNPLATYVCINKDEAYVPQDIAKQSVGIQNDIGMTLQDIDIA